MAQKELENKARHSFGYLNRYFMVPMFRLGFGPFMGTPFSGYIMVLKTIGKKTGKVRYAPVNYAIENVYCLAGFGKISDWYRNLLAHPNIQVIMPSGAITGIADQVIDSEERLRVIRQILINGGFAGFAYGYDPRTASDEKILETTGDIPVIRIRPTGIASGASDPGGWMWIATILINVALFIWLGRAIQKRKPRCNCTCCKS
jgi:deazaflavin-dependent oxidoreductase (nitroreductase family)